MIKSTADELQDKRKGAEFFYFTKMKTSDEPELLAYCQ